MYIRSHEFLLNHKTLKETKDHKKSALLPKLPHIRMFYSQQFIASNQPNLHCGFYLFIFNAQINVFTCI